MELDELLKDEGFRLGLEELVSKFTIDDNDNDLPISPGEWEVGGTMSSSYRVFSNTSDLAIARCYGPRQMADAKAIAALPELLRAARSFISFWRDSTGKGYHWDRLKEALKAAGIDI